MSLFHVCGKSGESVQIVGAILLKIDLLNVSGPLQCSSLQIGNTLQTSTLSWCSSQLHFAEASHWTLSLGEMFCTPCPTVLIVMLTTGGV